MRLRLAAVMTLVAMLLLAPPGLAAPPGEGADRSVGEIGVSYDCEAAGRWIASEKAISNVVYLAGRTPARIEFDADRSVFQYFLQAEDVSIIWVKAGHNNSGDGAGYGQRFDVQVPPCTDPGDLDGDDDGFDRGNDCDDGNPTVHPGATEIPGDSIDQNCDGLDFVVEYGADVRVTLSWASEDDLDLHVIDPLGSRIFWFNRTSPSGGSLDRDATGAPCGTTPPSPPNETTSWPLDPGAPLGIYTTEIYSSRDCEWANTSWTLEAFVGGTLVLSQSGTGAVGAPQGPLFGLFVVGAMFSNP